MPMQNQINYWELLNQIFLGVQNMKELKYLPSLNAS